MTIDYKRTLATRIPPQRCPGCLFELDGVHCFGDESRPEPGDFTVCIQCAMLLRFGDDMVLVQAALADVDESVREEFAKMIATIEALSAGGKRVVPPQRPM